MTQNLKSALQNPSVVLTSGPRPPASRPSVRKANGLVRFGAMVMLGAALLSPFNALAQNQQHLSSYEQTTEVVAEANETDWFSAEVDGRTWNNAPAEVGQQYNIPAWVEHGVVISPGQSLPANLTVDPIDIGGGSQVEGEYVAPVMSAHMVEHYARQEQKDIEARRDAPKFELKGSRYRWVKDRDLKGASLKEATPERMNIFISSLAQDAYIEMKAGHSVENPSQQLINICQQVEDVAKVAGPSSEIAHSDMVFEACHSEQMQSNMLVNTLQRGGTKVGLLLGAALVKGASLLAIFHGGAILASGAMGVRREEENEKKGFSSLLSARRTEGPPDPTPDAQVSQDVIVAPGSPEPTLALSDRLQRWNGGGELPLPAAQSPASPRVK